MAGIGNLADLSSLLIYRTDPKLIQESDLKDIAEILRMKNGSSIGLCARGEA